jgi:hypothetical protein
MAERTSAEGGESTEWQYGVFRTLKRLAPFLASPVMMRQHCIQRTKQSRPLLPPSAPLPSPERKVATEPQLRPELSES